MNADLLDDENNALGPLVNVKAVIDFQISTFRYRTERLNMYKDPFNKECNDPLKWWNDNKHSFPYLSSLAKRVLYIPATSAPSERVFSGAGLTISNDKARLLPEQADELIFMRNMYLNDA